MSVQSLQKVSSLTNSGDSSVVENVMTSQEVPAVALASSKATMRKMKAEQALSASLQSALEPKKLGEVDFSKSHRIDTNIKVTTGPGVEYNGPTFWNRRHYGNSWRMLSPGSSFIQADMNIQKDSAKTYTLDLNHLSSLVNGKPLSKITIEVNGQVVTAGHNPNNGNYITEQFDITQFVKDGNNQIKLKLAHDAYSHYWINHLTVLES